VFENRVLTTVFGPRREEVARRWRRLHNEALRKFYAASNIIRVIKSRRMRWAGHVARMGEIRMVGKLEHKRPRGKPWRSC
jgi:hypothetical protein